MRPLPTLTELQATPRATPKPTTLERAIANKAKRLADARQLRQWALAVKHRDGWTCRKTGMRLRRCLALDPLRAESHHVEPRANKAVRFDVRNGLTLSYLLHAQVERGDYRIEGTVFFRKGGATYINANFPVIFVRVR